VDGAAAEINMLATVYSCFSEMKGGKGTNTARWLIRTGECLVVNKDR
jgi:hypothetical protein